MDKIWILINDWEHQYNIFKNKPSLEIVMSYTQLDYLGAKAVYDQGTGYETDGWYLEEVTPIQ